MSKPKRQKEVNTNLTVIGGGELLTKYLLPVASRRQDFRIERIISRTEHKDFIDHLYSNQDYPRYRKLDLEKIVYQHTQGAPSDIVKKIKQTSFSDEAIVIATSPHTHFKILSHILTKTDKKIYLEKPAVTNLADFKSLIRLLNQYKNRIYAAEQYVSGRSVIFLEAYKKHRKILGEIKSAELYIEEGQRYFDAAQAWLTKIDKGEQKYADFSQSGFASVGPELDVGIHLLAILFKLIGEGATYQIMKAGHPSGYLKNYGAEAELLFTLKDKTQMNVFLRCGKREGENNRSFKIVCQNGQLWQRFTSGTCQDPVFIKINNKERLIAKYPADYHYFDAQISDFLSWLKKPFDQDFILRALECGLKIKDQRMARQEGASRAKRAKLVAMIPARMESKRIKNKSIRVMVGKPMIYYAIKAAVDARIFDEIYVNSESDLIGAIGTSLGVNYYKRDPELARDRVNNEVFVHDFLQNVKTDYLFMIHSNKPLITPEEIRRFVKTMLKEKTDTMLSVEKLQTQVFFKNKPVNFDIHKPHLRSWMIEPAYAVQWTITGWKSQTFLSNYKKNHAAVYSGKIGLFPLSEYSALSVDYEKDFILAEQILKTKLDYKKKALKSLVGQYRDKMVQVLDSLDLEKVQDVIKLLVQVYKRRGRIFVVGNGGSAATASHFAADISQNATRDQKKRVNAICLNDSMAKITAIANDLGYENIFKEQLYNVLTKNDVLMVMTGSGDSANIVEAIQFAGRTGAKTIGLLGFDGGRALQLVNLAVLIKSFDYTVIENIHMFICDLITNYFQAMFKTEKD